MRVPKIKKIIAVFVIFYRVIHPIYMYCSYRKGQITYFKWYKIWLGLGSSFFFLPREFHMKTFFSICGNDSVSYAKTRFLSREIGAIEPCVIKIVINFFLSSLIKITFSLNFLFLSLDLFTSKLAKQTVLFYGYLVKPTIKCLTNCWMLN